eukprot:IDg2750t1
MESIPSAGIRMEKLSYTNFYSWKQKIELVLGHREVDEMIDAVLCPPRAAPEAVDETQKWVRKDKTARMTIGLTLSNEMLKNVNHTTTALQMWQEICNVYQRHTLLNKLSARRDFYTATMLDGEKMLVYINRIRQMASVLQSMTVVIDDKEMAMAVLNGLPRRFETIITALDAIGDDDASFTFEKVRSRLLQEEKRFAMRSSTQHSTKTSALMNKVTNSQYKSEPMLCTHCGRKNHTEPYCWEKHGRPSSTSRRRLGRPSLRKHTTANAAVVTEQPPMATNEDCTSDFVCLISKKSAPRYGEKPVVWHIDSGASHHFTYARSAFVSYKNVTPFPVQMGDKSTALVIGRGDVHVPLDCNGANKICKISDVLHVPAFAFSLLSVSTLSQRGLCTRFSSNKVRILREGRVIATGSRNGGLYSLDTSSPTTTTVACIATLQLWHERMGHVNYAGLQRMARKNIVKGLHISPEKNSSPICEGCVMGKMPRTAIPRVSHRESTGLLDLIHSDIAGPLPIMSKGGAKYFVTFIDDKSRSVTVYPIATKSECFETFRRFQRYAERRTGRKIRAIRSDGGGEYTSNTFRDFLERNGIAQQMTVSYTPQQNGVAERMNRTLKDL